MNKIHADVQDNIQPSQAQPVIDDAALALRLRDEFDSAEKARSMVQLRWLDDLRQYRGTYDPKTMARLQKSKRAKVFYRMTTSKVNTMTARLMDLLFPQRSKNWSIEPSPEPVIPEDILRKRLHNDVLPIAEAQISQIMQDLSAQAIVPDAEAINKIQADAYEKAFAQVNTTPARVRVAKDCASAMERAIDDQLKEHDSNGQKRKSWQQNCRAVVKSACLYGMGVLKGPLVEKVKTKRFMQGQDENGNVMWSEQVVSEDLRPHHEAVSIWDIFPDPGARLPEELRYVWQLRLMTDKDLLELRSFPGFSHERILKHLKDNPDGDAQLNTWESQIRDLNEDNAARGAQIRNRYRVYERWGYLSGHDLAAAGVQIDEGKLGNVYPACVWMLGETIIKAMINPLEGVDIPYYFYPFQEDDTSFWPEGIATALRAPQAGINASVRSMQDNSASTSGPIIGLNLAHLAPGEDPTAMLANRVFTFDKPGLSLSHAFSATTVPSAINENMALASFWQNAADEVSTPRFNSGDGNVAGAGQTASGLSMLMGAANILLKDHIKDFDDYIIAPFIWAMFRWNMQWNPDPDIKGDFHVVASGSQSMIAKEVRAQQVPMLISYLSIPSFAPYIRPEKLLEVALEQTDLPAERILRSEDEANQYEQEQIKMQALAQAEANVEALTAKLQQQGMPPEMINRELVMLLAQANTQQQGGLQGGLPA